MVINIVALEMLGSHMPHSSRGGHHQMLNGKANIGGSSDEDPYSLTASASSGSSRKVEGGRNNISGDLSLEREALYRPQNWNNYKSRYQNGSEDDYVQNTHCTTAFKSKDG